MAVSTTAPYAVEICAKLTNDRVDSPCSKVEGTPTRMLATSTQMFTPQEMNLCATPNVSGVQKLTDVFKSSTRNACKVRKGLSKEEPLTKKVEKS